MTQQVQLAGSGQSLANDIEAKIRTSFAGQGFMTMLGAEISELSPGRCVLTIGYRPEVSQQNGYFHGAAVGALADVAGGYAACSLAPLQDDVLTVEYKLSLYAAATGRQLEAVANVLRSGRLTTCLIEVFDCHSDATRHPCATALQTVTRVAAPESKRAPVASTDPK
jgi:uncharacterized protein (TIGR00369 family)